MNPLLVKLPRRVQKVLTLAAIENVRQATDIYVRSVTGAEFLAMGEKVRLAKGAAESFAIQFEAAVSDAEGKPLLAAGEGVPFIEALGARDVNRIMSAFDTLNGLNEKAVEEELKN